MAVIKDSRLDEKRLLAKLHSMVECSSALGDPAAANKMTNFSPRLDLDEKAEWI